MNIWILKCGSKGFSSSFMENSASIIKEIDQLKHFDAFEKNLGNFHFISFATKFQRSQKHYILESKETLIGYSGLLLGKKTTDVDLRNIKNLDCKTPEKYNGQFALFEITNKTFSCKTDNLGFHKVFYFKKGKDIYVTNLLKLLELTGEIVPNPEQIITDFLTSRFGVFPGYNTLFRDVYTLPEYGSLKIDKNGLNVASYEDINSLLIPQKNFEENLSETIIEFKNSAKYLRNFHKTAIGLSGGFDGRLMLSFFYNTEGKLLETYTYNRAGKLDLWIASYLSKQFEIPHKKFKIKNNLDDFTPSVNEFKDSKQDPFTLILDSCIGDFFQTKDSFKVCLAGNGADIDSEFGEKHQSKLRFNNFKSFISSYSEMLVSHPLVSSEITKGIGLKLEKYFLSKYSVFENKEHYVQLLGSAFFHLERFRGEQGYIYSQKVNLNKDVFAPFAIESFNKTVFTATKPQLQRNLKEGIHFRLCDAITEGKFPYAPILTSKNEFGKNLFQKALNYIAPYLPKIIWKLNNGDTNQQIRNAYSAIVNKVSKEYIMNQRDSELWRILDYCKIKEDINNDVYEGQYNQIATMVKFLENRKK
tara:strand:+ start:1753 stop:3513 length:1761 start_codon:yes stop_codon:yes gene_type:complete